MNWDAVSAVAEMVAALGVIGSLLYLKLTEQGDELAVTLSHIGFKQLADALSDRLVEANNAVLATQVQENTLDVMRKRGVRLPAAVINSIDSRIKTIQGG